MKDDELVQSIIRLLEASEHRIDRTNEMISRLSDTMDSITRQNAKMLNAYDHHLKILQERCSKNQEMLSNAIEDIKQMTILMEEKEKTLQLIASNLTKMNVNVNHNA